MKDRKIDYEDEPQLWRKRKKNLTPKSYQMSSRRPLARRSPRQLLPPLQRPRHPPLNWGWRPCFGRWPCFQHYNRVTIQDWLPFLKKEIHEKQCIFYISIHFLTFPPVLSLIGSIVYSRVHSATLMQLKCWLLTKKLFFMAIFFLS